MPPDRDLRQRRSTTGASLGPYRPTRATPLLSGVDQALKYDGVDGN
jgi:hypothetical protein